MELIKDIRKEDQFKVTTFSKYQRVAVKKELINNLVKGKLEPACYWMVELICSGHFMDLWEIILFYYSKHIHVSNPKLPIYLDMRFSNFKKITETCPLELDLRNNVEIRKIFTEIISILCLSKKHHSYDMVQLNKEDFNVLTTERLKAPSIQYIEKHFKVGDPKELFIPLNEFSYMIDQKNTVGACYWIEWILHYTSKKKCACVVRDFPVKYKTDTIWIIWEIMMKQSNLMIQKIMGSLVNLFCIKYTPASKDRRRFLIYYAVSLCCDTILLDVDMISNKQAVDAIYEKCNFMYKDIKKNEIN